MSAEEKSNKSWPYIIIERSRLLCEKMIGRGREYWMLLNAKSDIYDDALILDRYPNTFDLRVGTPSNIQSPHPKGSDFMTNMEDLPDLVLVEILCRLPPNNKFSFQCKCVSKRWLSLLSDPYFAARFQRLQLDNHKPVLSTLALWTRSSGYSIISTNPELFDTTDFSFSFLPCYQDQQDKPPVVIGTHKDLVLCCATKDYQRDYYICNPYTKQWFSLPPTPRVHWFAPHAGFIVHELNGEDSSSTTCSIIPNADYRWKVVRILPNPSDMKDFHVEIFSSETREWIELVVLCHGPKNSYNSFYTYDCATTNCRRPLAYNGMLCWLCKDDFTFVLDAFSPSGDNIAKCRFIKEPDYLRHDYPERNYSAGKWLGVCGGRLQMCIATSGCSRSIHPDPVRIWELKEEVVLDHDNTIREGSKFKWLGKRISLPCKDIPFFSARRWYISRIQSFYPNYENAIYMMFPHEFVKCKLSGGTLDEVTKTPTRNDVVWASIYPFVLPGWPTPVPKQQPCVVSN